MSIAAAGVLRRAALNAFRLNSFRAAPPARTLSTGPKKPAAELTFKEAWLSAPATYPIVVIISSPYPASVKQRNHDQKSTSLYRGPCDRGAVVSWESTSVAEPKGQKGLFERAFYESRLRGRPRNNFYHTAAVIGCFSYCTFCLFCSPDVRITKTARSQVIRDWT